MKTNGCQTAPSSASELHAAYAAGTLTPMQATEHCLRVACASQSVFTRITADRALEEARQSTEMRVNTEDRKSTRLNSSHLVISYAVFCLKKKNDNACSSAWSPARSHTSRRARRT